MIHRDIKPSNLLIDGVGVVWLTDFGLARHADEVTLTASGALMGTPRYMSPEQAESLHRTIDHRTDIYSLGPSLYELATGRPAFDSGTAHGVVIQILTEEPARPRQLRPELPCDLETIIQTCLAKDPAQRYQTAQAVADDLRALGEGRAIRARRMPLVERCVRYVRKRKQALGRGSLVAAATVALLVGAFLGWRYYEDWRSGEVVLRTDGPPLRAQVLADASGEPVGEPFDIGTRTSRRLPAGEYRLVVTGQGLLGQTYRLGMHRGESRSHSLALDGDRLLGADPIPYRPASAALRLSGGKADVVEWTGETVLRRDGVTGQPVWDASHPATPWDPRRDPVAWMRRLSYHGDAQRPGRPVEPAVDLDGDGTADVVWAFRGSPSLLALSGKDAAASSGPIRPTRTAPADPIVPGRPGRSRFNQLPTFGRVLGSPSQAEVDGDGVADLIAAFAIFDDVWPGVRPPGAALNPDPGTASHPGRRVIAAVSGRSGRPLWTYAVDAKSTTIAVEPFDGEAKLLSGRRGTSVSFVDASRWLLLDPASGRLRGARPIELGLAPIRPVDYADFDGDGAPDLLALGSMLGASSQDLIAVSSATGHRLWTRPASIPYDFPHPPLIMRWPIAEDLDGDGRAEVIVPDAASLNPGTYRGIRVLDGATGETRWFRPLRPETRAKDGVEHLLAGPDLDGDGTRDMVAVSRYNGRNPFTINSGEPHRIYVDTLSGKDGHSLWWWHTDVLESYSAPTLLVGRPFWWGRGEDGWPMLALPLGGGLRGHGGNLPPGGRDEPARVHLISASSGRELHTIPGVSWPEAADLDGEGLDDLIGSSEGKLRAFRNGPRGLATLGQFDGAGDLDGDGIGDVIARASEDLNDPSSDRPTIEARSGPDGRLLWSTTIGRDPGGFSFGNSGTYRLQTEPLPAGDLDGDGAPDVVIWRDIRTFFLGNAPHATLPLLALSGRTARRLWSCGPLRLGFDAKGYTDVERVERPAVRTRLAGRSDRVARESVREPRFCAAGHGLSRDAAGACLGPRRAHCLGFLPRRAHGHAHGEHPRPASRLRRSRWRRQPGPRPDGPGRRDDLRAAWDLSSRRQVALVPPDEIPPPSFPGVPGRRPRRRRTCGGHPPQYTRGRHPGRRRADCAGRPRRVGAMVLAGRA